MQLPTVRQFISSNWQMQVFDILQAIQAISLLKSSVNLLVPSAQGIYSVSTPCSLHSIRFGR